MYIIQNSLNNVWWRMNSSRFSWSIIQFFVILRILDYGCIECKCRCVDIYVASNI